MLVAGGKGDLLFKSHPYPCAGGTLGQRDAGVFVHRHAGHDAGLVGVVVRGTRFVGVFVQFDIHAACGDDIMGDGFGIEKRQRAHGGNGSANHQHRQQ